MWPVMSALGGNWKLSSPVWFVWPLIVKNTSSIIFSHLHWRSTSWWSPRRSSRRTSALVTMRWWRCSAALISSVSVISALWMNIKTTTQCQLQQKGLRGRESSGWGDKQSSRESRTQRKTWSCFNRRRRPSMALLIKQWRTVRRSSLSWSVCWRKEALMWSSRSDPSRKLKWDESESFRRDWSRRSLSWRGETMNWSSSQTQRITTSFYTTTPHCHHSVNLHTHPDSGSVLWGTLRTWQQLCHRSEVD